MATGTGIEGYNALVLRCIQVMDTGIAMHTSDGFSYRYRYCDAYK
jgi:hypothetical protein